MNKSKNNKISGLRIGTDIVSAVFVGTVVGVYADKFFETSPYLLIFCILISFISAFKMLHKQIF